MIHGTIGGRLGHMASSAAELPAAAGVLSKRVPDAIRLAAVIVTGVFSRRPVRQLINLRRRLEAAA